VTNPFRSWVPLFIGGFVFLALASCAEAQCNLAFMEVATVEGNPFTAEKVTTTTRPPGHLRLELPLNAAPTQIARDSKGRVRIERVVGTFEIKSGPEAGTEVKKRVITICDPVSQTLTQLDTVNKTAMITRSQGGSALRAGLLAKGFCAQETKAFTGQQTEDLGHRTIDGFDAMGVRVALPTFVTSSKEGESSTQSTREIWCSEEMGAVLLQVLTSSRPGTKSEFALTNLVRQEPDPALFEIPADFTISERVMERMRKPQTAPVAKPTTESGATEPSPSNR